MLLANLNQKIIMSDWSQILIGSYCTYDLLEDRRIYRFTDV